MFVQVVRKYYFKYTLCEKSRFCTCLKFTRQLNGGTYSYQRRRCIKWPLEARLKSLSQPSGADWEVRACRVPLFTILTAHLCRDPRGGGVRNGVGRTILQCQKAVTAYFSSTQLPPFIFTPLSHQTAGAPAHTTHGLFITTH